MSDSNRGEKPRPWLKHSILGALFFAILLIVSAGTLHCLNYQEAHHNAASYAADAKNDIRAECLTAKGKVSSDCARNKNNAAREEQRKEYDLYAQKIMAIWTTVMGGMAIIGVSLSGVGVYLIWETFRQTQDAAIAANASKDAYIWNERARIAIKNFSGTGDAFDEGQSITQRITIENVGNSHARIISIKSCLTCSDGTNGDDTQWEINDPHIGIDKEEKNFKGPEIVGIEDSMGLTYCGVIEYSTLGSANYLTHFTCTVSLTTKSNSVGVRKVIIYANLGTGNSKKDT